jgi:ABC-type transport system substrate-binding protein
MGGVLRYGMGPNVEHIFHLTYSGGACAAWCMTVGDPITAYGPDSEWFTDKSLAESFDISDDQKTITFSLKSGIKFHDGTDVDANAIKTSLDFALNKENAVVTRSAIAAIIGVDVIDASTVSVTTEDVFAPIITNLGMTSGMPFSPTAFDALGVEGFENQGAPSTGPFFVKEWVSGSHTEYVRSTNYHREGKPFLDSWRWEEIPEDVVKAAAMQAGELDIVGISSSSFDAVDTLRAIDGIQEFKGFGGPRMDHFNAARAPWDDIRVRQAAQYAMDRVGWNQAMTGGEGHVYMGSLLPPTHAASFAVEDYPYDYDPAKSKSLLEEYAAEKGISLPISMMSAYTCTAQQAADGCVDVPEQPITITVSSSPQNIARAELSKAYYEAVGFKVEMDIGGGDEAKRTFVTKEASFSLRGYGLRPHPSGSFNSYLGMGGYWNNGGWGTSPEQQEIDVLVRGAVQTFDAEEQNEMYREAQRIYMEAALGGVRTANTPSYHFAQSWVTWEGEPDPKWLKYPSDNSLHMQDAWLDK